MPGARCTRGLVCKIVRRNAHEHTGSAEAIWHPCAMALRLMPRSLRRRIRLATVAAGLMAIPTAWHQQRVPGPHGFAVRDPSSPMGFAWYPSDEVLAKAESSAVRPARYCSLTEYRPANTFARRRCRVHRIPSRVRDDRDTPLVRVRRGELVALICPTG
jgi:hypothetical protein